METTNDSNQKLNFWTKVVGAKRGYIFLRTAPDGEVVGRIWNTSNVQVLESSGVHVKVFSPDLNKTGWIHVDYLKIDK